MKTCRADAGTRTALATRITCNSHLKPSALIQKPSTNESSGCAEAVSPFPKLRQKIAAFRDVTVSVSVCIRRTVFDSIAGYIRHPSLLMHARPAEARAPLVRNAQGEAKAHCSAHERKVSATLLQRNFVVYLCADPALA